MKLLRELWDFIFGAFLIGGAPLALVAGVAGLMDWYEASRHVKIPEKVGGTILTTLLVAGLVLYVWAIRLRLRRRIAPRDCLILEVGLGTFGALLYLLFMSQSP